MICSAAGLFWAPELYEPFALILSDSAGQAKDQLRHIRHELETNEAIARNYPAAAGVGPVWRQDRIELNNGAAVGGRARSDRTARSRVSGPSSKAVAGKSRVGWANR